VSKLLLIFIVCAAAANAIAATASGPPLLIDSHPAPTPVTTLDAQR